MLAKINSLGFEGIKGYHVVVEVNIVNGIPCFDMVGLPGASVRESRERVKAAISNTLGSFPTRRITANLAPADKKKDGAIYDVPIALGILKAMDYIGVDIDSSCFIGELSLDGSIRRVNGAIAMIVSALNHGFKRIFLPKENENEVNCIHNIDIIPVDSLSELLDYLNNNKPIKPIKPIDFNEYINTNESNIDFAYIKGQFVAKRALEIAASGGHNVLMIGPPGSGKTMMAKALSGILPPLTFEESLEVTKIHSIAGELKGNGLLTRRPFRNPHHTSSSVALTGGGTNLRPGEISLAHHGVLFLDELPEFQRQVLEALRQPLEDGIITVSRASGTCVFPSEIMLVASMNPCPCGHFGSKYNECTCNKGQISRYLHKVSGPLLDRIDIQLEVDGISFTDLDDNSRGESSDDILKRVQQARNIQLNRYKNDGIYYNAQLKPNHKEKYCKIDKSTRKLLNDYFNKLTFSARAYDRILKISRTIADLANSENIQEDHILEALQYRTLDRKYWTNGGI